MRTRHLVRSLCARIHQRMVPAVMLVAVILLASRIE